MGVGSSLIKQYKCGMTTSIHCHSGRLSASEADPESIFVFYFSFWPQPHFIGLGKMPDHPVIQQDKSPA